MKFRFISDYRSAFGVKKMCQTLAVSRSGFYAWDQRKTSNRTRENEALLLRIKEIYRESRGTYGSPRITQALLGQGLRSGHNRVARLMKCNGIRVKTKRRFKTTDSNHRLAVADNLLNQRFCATKPDEIWASDITYVRTSQGWLYLAVILDVYSRRIIGWSMSSGLSKELILHALNQAVGQRQSQPGIIFHSDRGRQYASEAVKELLNKHQFRQSMSRKGNCYDNAVVESFFSTLKTELIYQNHYKTKQQAKASIFEYIEVFYNRKRLHSAIEYKSPSQFEYAVL
jgi:putative transposase